MPEPRDDDDAASAAPGEIIQGSAKGPVLVRIEAWILSWEGGASTSTRVAIIIITIQYVPTCALVGRIPAFQAHFIFFYNFQVPPRPRVSSIRSMAVVVVREWHRQTSTPACLHETDQRWESKPILCWFIQITRNPKYPTSTRLQLGKQLELLLLRLIGRHWQRDCKYSELPACLRGV